MRWPLLVLAVPSAGLGFAGFALRLRVDWTAVASLVLLGAGIGVAVRWWRRGLDPVPGLLADGFHLDAVQDAVIVRPVLRLAALVRRTDESIVDGAVESTGRGAVRLGGLAAGWHRASLPRAATAVLGGALLLGLAALAVVGLR